MKELVKYLAKIGAHFEIAIHPTQLVNTALDISVEDTKKFKEVILEALNSSAGIKAVLKDIILEDFEVYVNRPPNTPFFPIAASKDQYKAFYESLENPPHALIQKGDFNLTLKEIIEKYKTRAYTLYKLE